MTIGPIDYEYKELGTLRLKSGKEKQSPAFVGPTGPDSDVSNERYLMWASFEAIQTGATYSAVFDDDSIKHFCPILNADHDLLDDFLVMRPNIEIQSNAVSVEFSLHLGSKFYTFTIEIPKFIPDGSLSDVAELYQKNNVLTRRIKTLEECVAQQNKNIIMLTDLCTQLSLNCCYAYPNEYIPHCIETVGEMPHYHGMMINHIKTMTSSGYRLLEMIKQNKLPGLKEAIVRKHKEIYLALIGGDTRDIEYVDKILQFCQIGIEIDNDCIFEGSVYLIENYKGIYKDIKVSMIEYFDYQVTDCIPLNQDKLRNALKGGHLDSKNKKYLDYTNSACFSYKCDDVREILIKLSKK